MGSVLPPLWLESPRHERWFRTAGVTQLPGWSTLQAEARVLQRAVERGEPLDRVRAIQQHASATPFPSPLGACDARNAVVFALLPSVDDVMNAFRRLVARVPTGLTEASRGDVIHTTLQSWYHTLMFRRAGCRVYVVDPHTFDLLVRTELPDIPASWLKLPLESFYLLLPRGLFALQSGGRRFEARGVTVSCDGCGPAPEEHREVRLWIDVDADGAGLNDGFVATTIQLRPDARLADVMSRGVEEMSVVVDSGELALDSIAKVVTGLCLYLMSEHPRLEPVPPAPRVDVARLHTAGKRRKAEQRNARSSRLGFIRVGGRSEEDPPSPTSEASPDERTEAAESPAGRWRLGRQVWVRGHWRVQPCGPSLRKTRLVWIRPYVKGPDFAATLEIRAARVQPARPVTVSDGTAVQHPVPP